MALAIEIYNGGAWNDVTSDVPLRGDPIEGIVPLEIEQVKESNTAILRFGVGLNSAGYDTGDEVRITDGVKTYFGGYIATKEQVRTGAAGQMYATNFECQDYNSLMDRIVIDDYTIDQGDTDATEIQTLRANYLNAVGVTNGTINVVQAAMPADLRLQCTFRQGMEQIAAAAGGAFFFIDRAKRLNYSGTTGGFGIAGPENLSDDLTVPFSVPYGDLSKREDGTRRINAVYIIGDGIEGWYPDPPGANYFQAIISNPAILTQNALDAYGAAVVDDWGSAITEYALRCWEDAFWTMPLIQLQHSDFLVATQLWPRRMTLTCRTDDWDERELWIEFGDHTTDSGYLGPSLDSGASAMSPHRLLANPYHLDTVTSAPTQGAIIVGDSTPEWDDLVHPAAANRYIQANAADPSWVANITLDDGAWIGAGGAAGRLQWNTGAAPDIIWVGDANFDMNGNDFIIDTDGDSYLHASADDVVDLVLATSSGEFAININAAEDFTFTANSFNVLSGSSITMADDTWIGLGAATGRLVFDTTPAIDIIVVNNGRLDLNGNNLILDADSDSYFQLTSDDEVTIYLSNTARYKFDAAEITLYNTIGTDALRIRNHGDVQASSADIRGDTQLGIAADNNVYVFIDADNGGTDARFVVSRNAETVAGATEVFRVTETGRVGVREASPAGSVHAHQDLVGGAIPALYLEQDDDSEEFIRFQGDAASGNLNRCIVDYGDESTSTEAVWLKVYVVDDGNQVTDAAYHILAYTLA